MSLASYLEAKPFTEIIPFKHDSHNEGVSFTGVLRKHPYDEEKCLLIADPSGREPAILEFRVADVLGAEEMPSPVDEAGKNVQLHRLWIRKGSFGIRYEPFEVDNPVKAGNVSRQIHERFMRKD